MVRDVSSYVDSRLGDFRATMGRSPHDGNYHILDISRVYLIDDKSGLLAAVDT